MKINTDSFFAGAFFAALIVTLSFFSGIAHAATCTPPPNCSLDGPVSVSTSDGQILQGNISGNSITIDDPGTGTFNGTLGQLDTFSATDQLGDTMSGNITIPDSCSQVNYEAAKLTYEECQQLANPSYDSSGNMLVCIAPVTTDCNMSASALGLLVNMGQIDQAGAQSCTERHTQYESELATYNACISAQQQEAQNQQQQLIQAAQQEQQAQIQDLNTSCQNASGQYAYYDQTNTKCACQQGYWLDSSNNQCEVPATVCANTLGQYSYPASDRCVCQDGFDGSSGTCVDERPVREITQKALDLAQTNQSCKDSSLNTTEMQQCIVYEGNPNSFRWQISDAQPQAQTNIATSTTPMTSLGQAIAGESQSLACRNGSYPYLGYDGMCYTTPQDVGAHIPSNQRAPKPVAVTAAQAFAQAVGYTPPASASTSSWHSQIKSRFNATTTAATTTESVTSSTPATAPKQKHWYEWLNPFNWFSWIH